MPERKRAALKAHTAGKWGGAAVGLCLGILAVYAVLWMMTGTGLFRHPDYNSYLLQAQRWLRGHLDVGENISYLELAEFGGKYYVSFPPVPSILLLPFCLLLGERTPETLIVVAIGLAGAVCAFRLARGTGRGNASAAFWTLFVTVGSNFLHVGFRADVWYFAQTAAFTFTMLALYYAASGRLSDGWKPCFFLALAFGCRPLQIVYLPLTAVLLLQKLKRGRLSALAAARRYWWWTLPPLAVGGVLMALNFARFGNPFQFGHDYLPEFAAPGGCPQFGAAYLADNLRRLWLLPEMVNGKFQLPVFNGCAFWLFSPIFPVFVFYFVRGFRKNIRSPVLLCCILSILLHFVLLCCHATLGGWQFGSRYAVDALPVLFFALTLLLREEASDFPFLTGPLFLWGLGLNLAGTVALLNHWLA